MTRKKIDEEKKIGSLPEISVRFLEAIEELGISAYKLAKEVPEISNSIMSHIKSGRNKPSDDVLNAFLKHFPQYNRSWLLAGYGERTNCKSGAIFVETNPPNAVLLENKPMPQSDVERIYEGLLEKSNAEISRLNREIGVLQTKVKTSQDEKEQMKNTIEDLQAQIEAYRDATAKYDGKTVDRKLPKYINVVNN